MLPQMLSATEVAKVLATGPLFVRRRLVPTHPDHIPSIKVGKKRLVKIEDLQGWLERHRSTTVVLLTLVTVLLTSSCMHRVTPDIHEIQQPVYHDSGNWAAYSTNPTPSCQAVNCENLVFVARNNTAMAEAVKKLCKNHVCIGPTVAGQVFVVERHKK